MNTQLGLERFLSYINCQLQTPLSDVGHFLTGQHRRAITISRQAGSGGHTVAERARELLQAQESKENCPWVVFDRNLVRKVLEEHNLPANLAKFMPEDRITEIEDTLDEVFGLHPPSWALVRKTADTILHLAEVGNVIVLGRGANVITAKLDYVFHVRLVGSLEQRVKRMQESEHLNAKSALELVQRQDLGRRRYLRKYFNKDIDDPLLYHLVINTDLMTCEAAAELIVHSVTLQPADQVPQLAQA
jgi:cytidylate kinase